MGDPTDDFCGPRPLRLGSFQDLLREHYLPAMEEQLAKPMFLWGGPREPSYWAESQRMTRSWAPMTLIPAAARFDDRLREVRRRAARLRMRARYALEAARDEWNGCG